MLVTEAAELTPGRALDIGSGEGGDALWLAARGWRVTGVDIAESALEKARRRVESIDPAAAGRIDWERHDVGDWAPAPRAFDLVTSHFMHLPDPERATMFRSLAAAVAPGGTLLIVGHDHSDSTLGKSAHPEHLRALMFGVDDVLTAISSEGLRVEVAESRPRAASRGHTGPAAVRDVVVRATRVG